MEHSASAVNSFRSALIPNNHYSRTVLFRQIRLRECDLVRTYSAAACRRWCVHPKGTSYAPAVLRRCCLSLPCRIQWYFLYTPDCPVGCFFFLARSFFDICGAALKNLSDICCAFRRRVYPSTVSSGIACLC